MVRLALATGTTGSPTSRRWPTASAELGLSVSLVLPCREVADTIGPVLEEVEALRRRAPIVDQVVVVDAGSRDGTADIARRHGAEVHDESELLPEMGPVLGKGDAMWRALSVARGDIVRVRRRGQRQLRSALRLRDARARCCAMRRCGS